MEERAIDRIEAELDAHGCGPGRNGSWRCPAHQDSRPSLSVTDGGDKVLLTDHGGCATTDVVAALGLTLGDLFDAAPERDNGKATISDTYDYVDEHGDLLSQVVRFSPKGFRQRRPDGRGRWTWKLGDTRRVLYRLPQVLTAVEDGTTIYIAEGEKDAHALERAGAVATCNPMGAGKWLPEYADTLAGAAEVIIVADGDDAGRTHALAVARTLQDKVDVVHIVEAAKGKDASDHLAAGKGLEDFVVVTPVEGADEELIDDLVKSKTGRDGYRLTDVGNASRLIRLANDQLRYAHAWGKWLVYRAGRWVVDEKDAIVTEHAKRVPRELLRGLVKVKGDKQREEFRHAIRSETGGSIAAMVRLARGTPGIIVDHEELDADPYLLNVKNGTVDLRTGEVRPHDPADLMTLQCRASFAADATAPLWESCLKIWQPDPEIRRYLQVRAGACATGIATESVDLDIGTGANGKSKYHGAIQHVLGPYAVVPHKSLLVAHRHEQHDTVRANLFRKRMAVAGETRSTDRLDEEQVKSLTGGDRLQGRRMREDPWEFQPTHTLVLFSNYTPRISGTDESVWRRVRLVQWPVTIPEDERDERLDAKLRAEAPGILRWIVEGARIFLAEGLAVPDAVRVATDKYRKSEDVVGRFIGEMLDLGTGEMATVDIKVKLEDWCAEEGIKDTPRMNDVATALGRAGCRKLGRVKREGRQLTVWDGVILAVEKDGDANEKDGDQGNHPEGAPYAPTAHYPLGNGLARGEPAQGAQGAPEDPEDLALATLERAFPGSERSRISDGLTLGEF